MSLIPFLFDESPLWRPSRLLDQRFGLALDPEDFLQPLTHPRMVSRCPAGYVRNWRSNSSNDDSGSVVSYDKDKFTANLDVQQFKPEEITVKVTGENTITIEGMKHFYVKHYCHMFYSVIELTIFVKYIFTINLLIFKKYSFFNVTKNMCSF